MGHPVLVVDDSAVARAVLGRRLDALGLAVVTAASAREAGSVDPAALAAALLDLELGDGLGTEVARRLREAAPALPIAFLSGTEDAALLADAARLGPVFPKSSGADEAARWIAGRAGSR
ncbi:MAG: response regulator [Polyangiaceae bacterium]|nr:response regulator [Polyangiaceae bacterium]